MSQQASCWLERITFPRHVAERSYWLGERKNVTTDLTQKPGPTSSYLFDSPIPLTSSSQYFQTGLVAYQA